MNQCEDCIYYAYDEEADEAYCEMELDEDEVYRLLEGKRNDCPFYQSGSSDYYLSRKQ